MILLACIYRWAYQIRMKTNGFRGIDLGTPRVATDELFVYSIISIILFIIISIVQKRYDLIGIGLESIKKFFSVWRQRTIIVTCLAYFGQWFLFEKWISRLVILWTAGGSLIILPLFEAIRRRFYTIWMKQFAHSVLILSRDTDQTKEIIDQINLPAYYDIHKKVFDWLLPDKIQEDIVLLVGLYTQDELQYIVDKLRLKSTQLYHISENHFVEDIIYQPSKIGGLRALRYTSSQIEWRSAIIKRIFDITAATIGIIITSPIMIITAIAIKLDSKWPIFYRQERVGKNRKNFKFTKFRSMYTHLSVGDGYGWQKAEKIYKDLVNSHANIRKGELPKIKNDPRVTKVGKIIRAASIDELPNLFSVITGDMSLIGPRPHLPSEIENYKPWQRRVLSVKPGITGYAQIHGRDNLTFDEEATKELEYIQNRSVFLDIYIIFATFWVLFWGRGK